MINVTSPLISNPNASRELLDLLMGLISLYIDNASNPYTHEIKTPQKRRAPERKTWVGDQLGLLKGERDLACWRVLKSRDEGEEMVMVIVNEKRSDEEKSGTNKEKRDEQPNTWERHGNSLLLECPRDTT